MFIVGFFFGAVVGTVAGAVVYQRYIVKNPKAIEDLKALIAKEALKAKVKF